MNWYALVLVVGLVCSVAAAAAEEGPEFGGAKASEWAERLEGADPEVQDVVRRFFSAGPEVMPVLVWILENGSSEAKLHAASIVPMKEEHAASAIPALVQALQDPDPLTRLSCARTLLFLRKEVVAAVRACERELNDGTNDLEVRRGAAAFFTLAREGAAPAEDSLREALVDPDLIVRFYGASALQNLGDDSKAIIAIFEEALVRGPVENRWTAAWKLGRLGPAARGSVPVLFTALSDPAARVSVASALPKIGPAEEIAVRLPALLGEESSRIGAVLLARELGEAASEAWPILLRVAAKKPDHASVEAERTLLELGAKAVPTLLHALGDEDAALRLQAGAMLLDLASHAGSALPEVLDAVEGADLAVNSLLSRVLAGMGPESIPDLLRALDERRSEVRLAVVRALARVGEDAGDEAEEAMLRILNEDPIAVVRAEAVYALGRIGGIDAITRATRAQQDTSPLVRDAWPRSVRQVRIQARGK